MNRPNEPIVFEKGIFFANHFGIVVYIILILICIAIFYEKEKLSSSAINFRPEKNIINYNT